MEKAWMSTTAMKYVSNRNRKYHCIFDTMVFDLFHRRCVVIRQSRIMFFFFFFFSMSCACHVKVMSTISLFHSLLAHLTFFSSSSSFRKGLEHSNYNKHFTSFTKKNEKRRKKMIKYTIYHYYISGIR